MRHGALAFALVTAACGASPAPASSPLPSGETAACRDARLAILADMAVSRDGAACTSASDCNVVTSPSHPDPELAEVVAATDAAGLEARAEAHLETCGAWAHHEAIDAVRVVEAACESGRCTVAETTLHVAPLE